MKEYVNSGAFFANTVKTNPKAPDYQGDILVDLKTLGIGEGKYSLKLAGWKKTSAKGTSFLSLSALSSAVSPVFFSTILESFL